MRLSRGALDAAKSTMDRKTRPKGVGEVELCLVAKPALEGIHRGNNSARNRSTTTSITGTDLDAMRLSCGTVSRKWK